MLIPRLLECPNCDDILRLIGEIDCKVTEIGNDIYNDLVYALNLTCRKGEMSDLLHYRRILVARYNNEDYASAVPIAQIVGKVKLITFGCIKLECCDECNPIYCDFGAGLGGTVDRVAAECDFAVGTGGTVVRV